MQWVEAVEDGAGLWCHIKISMQDDISKIEVDKNYFMYYFKRIGGKYVLVFN